MSCELYPGMSGRGTARVGIDSLGRPETVLGSTELFSTRDKLSRCEPAQASLGAGEDLLSCIVQPPICTSGDMMGSFEGLWGLRFRLV